MTVDNYKFYITYPQWGRIRAYPKIGKVTFQWERQERLWVKKIGSLKFINGKFSTSGSGLIPFIDFNNIYGHDRSSIKCEPLPIEVYRTCSGNDVLIFEGELHTVDGKFDVDHCTVDIEPRTLDKAGCILKMWEQEKNILDEKYRVAPTKLFPNKINITTCIAYYYILDGWTNPPEQPLGVTDIGQCGLNVDEWGVVKWDGYREQEPDHPYDERWRIEWTLAQEEIETSEDMSADGWINTGGNTWVRPISGGLIGSERLFNFEKVLNAEIPTYDFGQMLADFVEECGLTMVSNFLGINPDGTAPANRAYDLAKPLFYAHISDIQDPYAEQPATKLETSFKQLLTDLTTMFNLDYTIEGNEFRIEQISYFERVLMLDLTQLKEVKGKHAYSYDKKKLPRRESWTFGDDTESVDWMGSPIYYENCATEDKKDYNIQRFKTEFEAYFLTEIEEVLKPDEAPIFLFHAGIPSTIGKISGEAHYNAALSTANIIEYHFWNRPQWFGTWNEIIFNFESVQPTRKQENMQFKMCCDDVFIFDPAHWVKSQLGFGQVESAEMEDTGLGITINLELAYE